MTAFSISAELAAITQKIIDQEGELMVGDLETLQTWNIALEDKGENIGIVIDKLTHEAAYFEAVQDRAANMRKSREKAVDRLRKYLRDCMKTADKQQLKKPDGLYTISLCAGRASVVVENPDLLPIDLVETKIVNQPNLSEIKRRIESGEAIPGAKIEIGDFYIKIR